jgi:hypothetical protein
MGFQLSGEQKMDRKNVSKHEYLATKINAFLTVTASISNGYR